MQYMRPDYVDLTPLLDNPAASKALMLARGQLNRAFRSNGLEAPDTVPVAEPSAFDPIDLEDPAGAGVAEALHSLEDGFLTWSRRMPRTLVPPVLAILKRTYQAPGDRAPEADQALLNAFTFLSHQAGASDG